MDVIIGVRGHLAGLQLLTALVPVTRIYSPILESKTFSSSNAGPAIQLQVLPNESEPHLHGPSQLFIDQVQVDAWARTMDQARLIGTLCRRRLDGFKGVWFGTGSPAPFLAVRAVFFMPGQARELFEDEIQGGLCRHLAVYQVTYTNSEEQMLVSA